MLKIKKSELDNVIVGSPEAEYIKLIKLSLIIFETVEKRGVSAAYPNVCEIVRIYTELKEWLDTIIEIEEDIKGG